MMNSFDGLPKVEQFVSDPLLFLLVQIDGKLGALIALESALLAHLTPEGDALEFDQLYRGIAENGAVQQALKLSAFQQILETRKSAHTEEASS